MTPTEIIQIQKLLENVPPMKVLSELQKYEIRMQRQQRNEKQHCSQQFGGSQMTLADRKQQALLDQMVPKQRFHRQLLKSKINRNHFTKLI